MVTRLLIDVDGMIDTWYFYTLGYRMRSRGGRHNRNIVIICMMVVGKDLVHHLLDVEIKFGSSSTMYNYRIYVVGFSVGSL